MNSDSYKIIVSLSHQRIAYEYWLREGEQKLVPMPNGNWPAPLAFFCTDTGIIVGEDAARAAHNGNDNAFDNYFERLTEDKTYKIAGQSRPIRNLLFDASESIFRDFFREVLFNSYGALSDNRAGMPLTIACESDVEPPERALLNRLFRDSGYGRVMVVDYDTYIGRYIKESLSKEYVCDKVLVAWTEGINLIFTLFDVNGSSAPKQKSFAGLGIDPRKEYVKNLIWESVVGQNLFLMKADEEDAINKAASDFLGSSLPMITDTIRLSDGREYHYSLNRNTIDCIQSNEGVSIKNRLEEFLRDNGITNRSRVLLLLRGVAAGNSYFEQNLSQGFSKTIKTDRKLRDSIMKLLISEDNPQTSIVSPPPPLPKPPVFPPPPPMDDSKRKRRRWREVRAEANGKKQSGQPEVALQILKDFLSECESCSGVDDLLSDIKAEIETVRGLLQVDSTAVRNLRRRWREIKADVKGKTNSGRNTEAIAVLQSFANEVSKERGTDELLASIKSELSSIKTDAQKQPKHQDGDIHPNGKWVWVSSAAGGKGDWRVKGGRIHTQAKEAEKEAKDKVTSEAQELIRQGRLKEARDWYRNRNNKEMAKILSEIIRSQKGVDMRKSGIEEYRKTKDQVQIKRIIEEIQGYIELCDKAGVNTGEYKKLLAEYKKILHNINSTNNGKKV